MKKLITSELRAPFQSKANPLGLILGDSIRILKTTFVDYDTEDNRVLFHHDLPNSKIVKVTGLIKKALGKYQPASPGHDEYEQASLIVSKYVWLYECKSGIQEKPLLVAAENIYEL